MRTESKVQKFRLQHKLVGIIALIFGTTYLVYILSDQPTWDLQLVAHILVMSSLYLYGGYSLIRVSNAMENNIIEHIERKEKFEKEFPPAPWWGWTIAGVLVLCIVGIAYYFLYVEQ